MKRTKKHNLLLVSLNPEQITKAKEANGSRKSITHALVCGPYGQIFGTEKQCLKYYAVWLEVFPLLFAIRKKTKRYALKDFNNTFNLANKLIEAHDALEKT